VTRALALLVAAAALALAITALVRHGSPSPQAEADALAIERTVLRPGLIEVTLHNGGAAPARIAQVIVNDAFVDFHAERNRIGRRESAQIAIPYPWVHGESYEIEVLTSASIVDGEVDA
jgi:uncharacterized protein (DUF58 family)